MIIDTMDVNIIKLFKIHLNKSLNKINKSLKMDPRQRILFKDIIYYYSYMIGNNFSYDLVNSKLKIDNILDVPKKSLVKNRNKRYEKIYINILLIAVMTILWT